MLLLSIFLERPLNIGLHHGFPPFEEGLELRFLPDSLKEGDVGDSSWLVTSDRGSGSTVALPDSTEPAAS